VKWEPNFVHNVIGRGIFGDIWPELVEIAEIKEDANGHRTVEIPEPETDRMHELMKRWKEKTWIDKEELRKE